MVSFHSPPHRLPNISTFLHFSLTRRSTRLLLLQTPLARSLSLGTHEERRHRRYSADTVGSSRDTFCQEERTVQDRKLISVPAHYTELIGRDRASKSPAGCGRSNRLRNAIRFFISTQSTEKKKKKKRSLDLGFAYPAFCACVMLMQT